MGRDRNIMTSRWPAWLNATALLLASVVAVAALSRSRFRPGAEIAAVAFPPWWNTQQIDEAAASADAAIVRPTALAAILVVRPTIRKAWTVCAGPARG